MKICACMNIVEFRGKESNSWCKNIMDVVEAGKQRSFIDILLDGGSVDTAISHPIKQQFCRYPVAPSHPVVTSMNRAVKLESDKITSQLLTNSPIR